MSIEKHLVARASNEPGRIHDLTLETKERPRWRFDVQRDITSEDWNGILELLNVYRSSNWRQFATHASNLRLLDPSRDLGITESDWNAMRKRLDSERSSPNWWQFAYHASSLRILDPSRDLGITESDWNGMRKELDSKRSSSEWWQFSYLTSNLRLLDPSRDLGITESDWNAMRKQLDSERSLSNWRYFAYLASSLRILAAHDVRITAPGKIEITDHPPDLTSKPTPRPERKQV